MSALSANLCSAGCWFRCRLHLCGVSADHWEVNLTQCPYDGAQVDVEVSSGGTLLLTCVACGAVWERHGAWTGRVREPDRDKLLAARRHGGTIAPSEPLPMVPADIDGADRVSSS